MRAIKTHYDNLQVARNASPEVIRAAYKGLTQRYHPDRHPDDRTRCERIMKIINEAFAVLSDPGKRAEHDAWIAQQEAAAEPQFRAQTAPFRSARGDTGPVSRDSPGHYAAAASAFHQSRAASAAPGPRREEPNRAAERGSPVPELSGGAANREIPKKHRSFRVSKSSAHESQWAYGVLGILFVIGAWFRYPTWRTPALWCAAIVLIAACIGGLVILVRRRTESTASGVADGTGATRPEPPAAQPTPPSPSDSNHGARAAKGRRWAFNTMKVFGIIVVVMLFFAFKSNQFKGLVDSVMVLVFGLVCAAVAFGLGWASGVTKAGIKASPAPSQPQRATGAGRQPDDP